jgi:hypothetical protein
MSQDDWLERNWQSRQEMIGYFKSHPRYNTSTVNLSQMDPATRVWMMQHFKKHPNLFRAKARKKQWGKPGRPPLGRPSPGVSPSPSGPGRPGRPLRTPN